MEEFKEFIINILNKSSKVYLPSAVLIPLISALFWAWFLSPFGTTVILPYPILLIAVFGIFSSPLFIIMYFRTRNVLKRPIYKMLFVEPENMKSVSIKRSYSNYTFNFLTSKSLLPKILIINGKVDCEKFIRYLNLYYPNLKFVK